MSCPYEYFLEVSDASGPHGPECCHCDELCEHNDRYNFETDTLDPDPALMETEEEN